MATLFRKLLRRLKNKGLIYVFTKSFEQVIRFYLPRRGYVTYNSVAVEEKRLGDDAIGLLSSEYRYRDRPEYEGPYVAAIREYFTDGDAIMVGGGMGVSIVAAVKSNQQGEITIYEGSSEQVKNVERTVALNDISSRVTVIHGMVGEQHSVRGTVGNATAVTPDELPDADALFVDCDGCEFSILSSLSNWPKLLIVEHHAVENQGERVVEYQPASIKEVIQSNSYEIVDETVIDHHLDKLGIFVAKRRQEKD